MHTDMGFMDENLDFSDDEFILFKERSSISIPIDVNQINLLPDIWIPSHLLQNRKQSSNNREANGHINIYHVLEKRDSLEARSFSVYSDSEGEILSSDSEIEDLKLDIGDCKNFENRAKTLSENALAVTTLLPSRDMCKTFNEKATGIAACSNLKRIPSMDILCTVGLEKTLKKEKTKTDSHISLNEILDNTAEYQLNDFKHDDIKISGQKKLERNGKKKKKKNKTTKVITLDAFKADYTEQDLQNDCCNEYLRILQLQNNQADSVFRSPADFPDLPPKGIQFIHSEKSETKKVSQNTQNMSMVAAILSKSNEVNVKKNESTDCVEQTACAASETEITHGEIEETEITHGKFAIENIPKEAKEDDIISFFSSLGNIQDFSLIPVKKLQKAHIIIQFKNSSTDIDWIIGCFDGEYAFGPCEKPLKCYKVK